MVTCVYVHVRRACLPVLEKHIGNCVVSIVAHFSFQTSKRITAFNGKQWPGLAHGERTRPFGMGLFKLDLTCCALNILIIHICLRLLNIGTDCHPQHVFVSAPGVREICFIGMHQRSRAF